MRISDWSSDVCSSDLAGRPRRRRPSDERSWPRAERVETGGLPFRRDACLGQLAHRGADPVGDLLQLASIEVVDVDGDVRSEEHTSELQSLMRISYAVFCLKKKKEQTTTNRHTQKE